MLKVGSTVRGKAEVVSRDGFCRYSQEQGQGTISNKYAFTEALYVQEIPQQTY